MFRIDCVTCNCTRFWEDPTTEFQNYVEIQEPKLHSFLESNKTKFADFVIVGKEELVDKIFAQLNGFTTDKGTSFLSYLYRMKRPGI